MCPNQEIFVWNTDYIELSKSGDWKRVWRYPGDNHRGSLFVWVYGVLANGVMRRILCWQQYMLGFDGLLFWNLGYFRSNPWASDKIPPGGGAANGNGDGILIYPGGPIGQDPKTPIASLRLKQYSNGMDDYDYFRLYEEAVGKDATRELIINNVMFGAKTNKYNVFQRESAYTAWNCLHMEKTRRIIGNYLSEHPVEHKFGEWVRVVDGNNSTHRGMEVRTCSICGAQEHRHVFSGASSNKAFTTLILAFALLLIIF